MPGAGGTSGVFSISPDAGAWPPFSARKRTGFHGRVGVDGGLRDPGMDNGGAFHRFQIINRQGTLMGALRPYAFTEERGLSRPPVFVPVHWDGTTLVIPATRYFYCDESVQADCCPAEASLRISAYRDRDGMVNPEHVTRRTWKRAR